MSQLSEVLSSFHEVLVLIFENWTAVRLSIQFNHVTTDLINDFRNNIEIWFSDTEGKIPLDELEQYMSVVCSEDLDMDIEDGSIKQVAQLILECWRRLLQGEKDEVLQELRGQREKWQGLEIGLEKQITLEDVLGNSSDEEDENSNDEMKDDDKMETDEDTNENGDNGWTFVAKR